MAKPTEQYRADLILWSARHNGRRAEPRRAIVIHTDESAYNYATGKVRSAGWTAKRLAEYNAEGGRSPERGSYHNGVDEDEQVVRQVNDIGGTWSVGNRGNNEAIHLCAAGSTAYWTREQWLAKPKLLGKLAEVTAHSALFHGIPIRKIDHNQIRAGAWGISGHWDWSKAYGGSSHWDPGGYPDTAGGFPWDHFINLVQGHADRMLGKVSAPSLKESELSDISTRRIELIMDQLAGPGKQGDGLPSFNGWDPDSVLAAAHYNLEHGKGLTLVQQIALVLEGHEDVTGTLSGILAGQEAQQRDIATLASAVAALTQTISNLVPKEHSLDR